MDPHPIIPASEASHQSKLRERKKQKVYSQDLTLQNEQRCLPPSFCLNQFNIPLALPNSPVKVSNSDVHAVQLIDDIKENYN